MKEITISIDSIQLKGLISIPQNAKALIIFAHGSGSSRLSPRNQFVANYLVQKGLAALLFDLLTEEEEATQDLRFEIDLLSQRLVKVTKWALQTYSLIPAYFGSSTGAAAALVAASQLDTISALVCRGGRPDLAQDILKNVKAPTLFIVGGQDTLVIDLNKQAFTYLQCVKKLEIVEGATHLFEEKGKLDDVAKLAASWFLKHLSN